MRTRCPHEVHEDALSARSPEDALSARSPEDALSARSPEDALSARSPEDQPKRQTICSRHSQAENALAMAGSIQWYGAHPGRTETASILPKGSLLIVGPRLCTSVEGRCCDRPWRSKSAAVRDTAALTCSKTLTKWGLDAGARLRRVGDPADREETKLGRAFDQRWRRPANARAILSGLGQDRATYCGVYMSSQMGSLTTTSCPANPTADGSV
jgi:hypothetical protein